jgi:hypothetical protein
MDIACVGSAAVGYNLRYARVNGGCGVRFLSGPGKTIDTANGHYIHAIIPMMAGSEEVVFIIFSI